MLIDDIIRLKRFDLERALERLIQSKTKEELWEESQYFGTSLKDLIESITSKIEEE
jgi:hypothetical protein